jgi:hypothetical protein
MPGGANTSVDWLRRHLAHTQLKLLADHVVLAGTPFDLILSPEAIMLWVDIDDEIGCACSVM